ncbi:hypothetical protein Daus18300_008324 [Diaporthe australafricana]|uniref:Uncharacterized protein n=1 Tax=Diaporthe australafricana TaxID=127596 RepID=A0ABR3WJ55_9PEZI
MAQSSTRAIEDPPISDLLRRLYSRVTASTYQHDMNPWNDPDPDLQLISTASLEVLRDYTTYHMSAFLHMHDILNKEVADRNLSSRFTTSDTNASASRPSEVLFSIDDFEPLSGFLGAEDSLSDAANGPPEVESEHRDIIARMGHAWVVDLREAERQSRPDGPRPVSVKAKAPDEVVAQIDIEGAESGSMSFEDVVALEDEMDGYI